jgi:hypothetical protein
VTATRLHPITIVNLQGRETTLTLDEMLEVHWQAWRCHRARPGRRRRQLVDLRANLMARILGRKARHGNRHVYTADADTDEISCGLQRIWKTGGRQIVVWILAHTTEDDLALCDYAERLMWLSHYTNLVVAGHPVHPEHAPTAWRDGKQMPEDEYRAMLRRSDEARGGTLTRLEERLAALLSEGGVELRESEMMDDESQSVN